MLPKRAFAGLSHRLIGIGNHFANLVPGLKYDLKKIDAEETAGEYVASAIVNAIFLFAIFFPLLAIIQLRRIPSSIDDLQLLSTSLEYSAAFFAMVFAFYLYNPHIQALKKGESIDKDLVFALKDMLLQVSSGVSLFNAMANASKAGYGQISKEFEITVREINAGVPEDEALEKMAFRTESEFFKQAAIQLVTAVRSGSPVENAIRSIILSLTAHQRSQIKGYSAELNLWVLIYMIFAVAIPGLGAAALVVLSAFGTINVSEPVFLAMIATSFFAQAAIIGFTQSRRPAVHL